MKTIMKEFYVSEDGKEFATKEQALNYEEFKNSVNKEVYIITKTYNDDTNLLLKHGIIVETGVEQVKIKLDDNSHYLDNYSDLFYSIEPAIKVLNTECDRLIEYYERFKNDHLKNLKHYLKLIKIYKDKKLQRL